VFIAAALVGVGVMLVASAVLDATWVAVVGFVLLVSAALVRDRLTWGRNWWAVLVVVATVVAVSCLAQLFFG
jgi:hypothetical protein